MKGGKREGAGRPPAADKAVKLVTVKMTPSQHQKFLELGGSRWLKRMIETAFATGKRQSRVTELDTVGQMQNLWHLLTVALKDR